MHKVGLRPVSSKSPLKESDSDTKQLQGGTKESSVYPAMVGHWLALRTNQWFFRVSGQTWKCLVDLPEVHLLGVHPSLFEKFLIGKLGGDGEINGLGRTVSVANNLSQRSATSGFEQAWSLAKYMHKGDTVSLFPWHSKKWSTSKYDTTLQYMMNVNTQSA